VDFRRAVNTGGLHRLFQLRRAGEFPYIFYAIPLNDGRDVVGIVRVLEDLDDADGAVGSAEGIVRIEYRTDVA
jgi:hypothetical protein